MRLCENNTLPTAGWQIPLYPPFKGELHLCSHNYCIHKDNRLGKKSEILIFQVEGQFEGLPLFKGGVASMLAQLLNWEGKFFGVKLYFLFQKLSDSWEDSPLQGG